MVKKICCNLYRKIYDFGNEIGLVWTCFEGDWLYSLLFSTHSDDLASFEQELDESLAGEYELNIQKNFSEKLRKLRRAHVRICPVVFVGSLFKKM